MQVYQHFYAFTFQGTDKDNGKQKTCSICAGLDKQIGEAGLLTIANIRYLKDQARVEDSAVFLNYLYLGYGTDEQFWKATETTVKSNTD